AGAVACRPPGWGPCCGGVRPAPGGVARQPRPVADPPPLPRSRSGPPPHGEGGGRVARRQPAVLETSRRPRRTLPGALVFMPSIADTVTETIQWVFPEHAGAPGQIHGGRMMQWITQAGTMAAAPRARGTVPLRPNDDIA